MLFVRWLFRIAAALLLLSAGSVLYARSHDGPLGPLPGGPLRAGPLVTAPVADWSFAAATQEIALQLETEDRSRTTWIVVHEGRAYIPAAAMFPPGKKWHRDALADGRATLRVDGKRYPVTLTKVEDAALVSRVHDVAAAKYPTRPGGDVWLFAVASRNGSG